jgi:SagB-type dehydrogenase family enzyme
MSDAARKPPSHAALDYHRGTSHVPGKLGGHGLDWGSQPTLYKEYRTLPGIGVRILPEPEGFPSHGLDTVLEGRVQAPPVEPVDMAAALSRVLAQACGSTAVSRHGRGDFHYRAAASAGALYPVECYVALSRSAPLPDGSATISLRPHYYHPLEHALLDLGVAPLALEQALQACGMAQDSGCIAAFFLTGIWYRSAWKYRERAYRYVLLDAGHVLENLLLALRAEGLSATIRYDFHDAALNQMLCLDQEREECLAVVLVRGNTTSQESNAVSAAAEPASEPREGACSSLAALSRTASREVPFPAINAVHAAGDRHGPPPDYRNNRNSAKGKPVASGLGKDLAFAPLPDTGAARPMPPPHQCIFRRRSRRNYVPQPLEWSVLGNALHLLLRPDPPGCNPDCLETAPNVALALHMITGVGDAGGDGLFLLRSATDNALEWAPLRGGSVQEKLAAICLGQAWLQHANALFLFLADIGELEAIHGARGYRQIMLEAGRLGERVYLLATALGLGACGIGAFFDAPATELIGLGRDMHLLHLTAMGRVRG